MRKPTSFSLDRVALQALQQCEIQRYIDTHPASVQLAQRAAPHYLFGVPMHWMRDWPTPVPLHVQHARGNRITCADEHGYIDFCLGDTGAMFGHSPKPVADALAHQAAAGLTAMLPSAIAADVGALLQDVFGLPCWQLTLSASDANRFVLRWARAITGRRKLLVFDGCYHGTVDDTLVDRGADGQTLTRASLLGQVHDLSLGTVVVPFNDPDAVQRALAGGDIACVLTEPALTNCGLVLPQPGFLDRIQTACQTSGTPLVLDETHTISEGRGGYARVHGLKPDVIVVGKALAGGLPCAAYGFTADMAARMQAAKAAAPEGHSGIGTTLSANLLAFAALRASLSSLMTASVYAGMLDTAARLQQAIEAVIDRAGAPWSVSRLGTRMELQLCTAPPRDGQQARAAMDDDLQRGLHLFLLNRGILITPFHNMLLVCPDTADSDVATLSQAFASFIHEVRG
jgi:glutamate-1-semialdehyde 2,1-aminomutase